MRVLAPTAIKKISECKTKGNKRQQKKRIRINRGKQKNLKNI